MRKKISLAELEVQLRDKFQRYRRRLDMVSRFRALGKTENVEEQGFVNAMLANDEDEARRIMKVIEVRRS